MKTLKCKCGRDILVDDEDFDRVREFNWNCHGGRPVKVTYRRVVLRKSFGVAITQLPLMPP